MPLTNSGKLGIRLANGDSGRKEIRSKMNLFNSNRFNLKYTSLGNYSLKGVKPVYGHFFGMKQHYNRNCHHRTILSESKISSI